MSATFKTLLIGLLLSGLVLYAWLERESAFRSSTESPIPRAPESSPPKAAVPTASPLSIIPAVPHLATCTNPLQLRIGQVDPEFNLNTSTLEKALRSATTEWNNATGHVWFHVSDSEGVVVNLLFDGRQEDIEQRRALEEELDAESTRLKEQQAERAKESLTMKGLIASWEQDKARFEARIARYNTEIARVAGVERPDRTLVEGLQRENEELATKRQRLEESAETMKREIDLYNQRALATQREGEQLSDKVETLQKRFPARLVKEAEHRRGAFVNEINIYTYTDEENLHFALLHELGHTIGLPHSDIREAIMAPVRELGVSSAHLTPSDIAAARSLCPTT